jgi:hypothetical protein
VAIGIGADGLNQLASISECPKCWLFNPNSAFKRKLMHSQLCGVRPWSPKFCYIECATIRCRETYYQYIYDIFAQKLGQPRRTSTEGFHTSKEDNTKHGSKSLLGPEQVLRDKFIKSVIEVLHEICHLSVTNHNITITPAIISRPGVDGRRHDR